MYQVPVPRYMYQVPGYDTQIQVLNSQRRKVFLLCSMDPYKFTPKKQQTRTGCTSICRGTGTQVRYPGMVLYLCIQRYTHKVQGVGKIQHSLGSFPACGLASNLIAPGLIQIWAFRKSKSIYFFTRAPDLFISRFNLCIRYGGMYRGSTHTSSGYTTATASRIEWHVSKRSAPTPKCSTILQGIKVLVPRGICILVITAAIRSILIEQVILDYQYNIIAQKF